MVHSVCCDATPLLFGWISAEAAGSCRLKWFSVAYRPWNLLRTVSVCNVSFKMLRLYGRRRTWQGVLAGGECVLQNLFTYFGDKLGLVHFHVIGSPKSSDVCGCLEDMTSRQFLLGWCVDFPLARGYHAVTCRWVVTSMLRHIMAASCHGWPGGPSKPQTGACWVRVLLKAKLQLVLRPLWATYGSIFFSPETRQNFSFLGGWFECWRPLPKLATRNFANWCPILLLILVMPPRWCLKVWNPKLRQCVKRLDGGREPENAGLD